MTTPAQRTRIRRHPERSVPEETAAILAEGHVAHVGLTEDGRPFVIPMLYQFSPDAPDRLYLHGSRASRLQRHLVAGEPVCVTVTLVDGLVYSRDAKYHSANYRSAVCFGRATEVTDLAAKNSVLEAMTARYFPGRTAGRDYVPATRANLDEITLVEVVIEEWSAKARRGGPAGPNDAADSGEGTRGVIDMRA